MPDRYFRNAGVLGSEHRRVEGSSLVGGWPLVGKLYVQHGASERCSLCGHVGHLGALPGLRELNRDVHSVRMVAGRELSNRALYIRSTEREIQWHMDRFDTNDYKSRFVSRPFANIPRIVTDCLISLVYYRYRR